jgi:hypothetical protein
MRVTKLVAAGDLAILSLVAILSSCAPGPGPGYPPRAADKILEWRELKVVELNMSPDPVRTRERVQFSAEIYNRSYDSGTVGITLNDRDQVVSYLPNVVIRPGANRIVFPHTAYHFQKQDHCFVVKVNIKGNEYPVDLAKQFCAYRMQVGWSLR